MRHSDYSSYSIDLLHTTKFQKAEFEYMFRSSMKPAIESYYRGKSLRWIGSPDIDLGMCDLLHVQNADGSWESVTRGVGSLSLIVAKYMVRMYGFVIQPDHTPVASINFDDDLYAGNFGYCVENNDVWASDIAAMPREAISLSMENSIELLGLLDNLKKDMKILPSKLMTLDEFMDFYNDTPTDEYELSDVCMRYEVYKENYGNDQSIER